MAGLGASAAAFAPTFVRAQNAQNAQSLIQLGMGDGQKFDPALVLDIARQLARRPFMPVASDLPDVFTNLSQEQYAAIKALPSSQIWADGRGISVEPLHRGFVFNNPVGLHLVEDGLFAASRTSGSGSTTVG